MPRERIARRARGRDPPRCSTTPRCAPASPRPARPPPPRSPGRRSSTSSTATTARSRERAASGTREALPRARLPMNGPPDRAARVPDRAPPGPARRGQRSTSANAAAPTWRTRPATGTAAPPARCWSLWSRGRRRTPRRRRPRLRRDAAGAMARGTRTTALGFTRVVVVPDVAAARAAARPGEDLVLLRAGARPRPEWLAPLQLAAHQASGSVVGPRLLHADGTLASVGIARGPGRARAPLGGPARELGAGRAAADGARARRRVPVRPRGRGRRARPTRSPARLDDAAEALCAKAWAAGRRVLLAPASTVIAEPAPPRAPAPAPRAAATQGHLRHAGHRDRRRAPRHLHAPERARRARPRGGAVDARARRPGLVRPRTRPSGGSPTTRRWRPRWRRSTPSRSRRGGRPPRGCGRRHASTACPSTGSRTSRPPTTRRISPRTPTCSRPTGRSSRTSPAASGSRDRLRELDLQDITTFTPGIDLDEVRPLDGRRPRGRRRARARPQPAAEGLPAHEGDLPGARRAQAAAVAVRHRARPRRRPRRALHRAPVTTRTSTRSTTRPRSSCRPPSTRASASPCWRPWPPAPPSSPPTPTATATSATTARTA